MSTAYLSDNAGFIKTLNYYGGPFWDHIGDQRTIEYPLLRGGPSHLLAIVGLYLYFVIRLGPRLMERRQKFDLNKFLLAYNTLMATANLWLFVNGMQATNFGLDTWGCANGPEQSISSSKLLPVSQLVIPATSRGVYLGYLFYLTKLIELLDTVFFILRKKHQQVTFLHVFHHAIVPIFCWLGLKLAPGGANGFFPLINSFIHVIMYTYYGLSTLGPSIQPHLWWKRYLTRLQMIQFILIIINGARIVMMPHCKFPRVFAYLQASIAGTFLILFAIFYKRAYPSRNERISTESIKQE